MSNPNVKTKFPSSNKFQNNKIKPQMLLNFELSSGYSFEL